MLAHGIDACECIYDNPSSSHPTALRSPRCGSVASVSNRRQSTKAIVESSLQLSRKDDGAHMYRLLSAKRNHIQELSNDAVCLQKKIKVSSTACGVYMRILFVSFGSGCEVCRRCSNNNNSLKMR